MHCTICRSPPSPRCATQWLPPPVRLMRIPYRSHKQALAGAGSADGGIIAIIATFGCTGCLMAKSFTHLYLACRPPEGGYIMVCGAHGRACTDAVCEVLHERSPDRRRIRKTGVLHCYACQPCNCILDLCKPVASLLCGRDCSDTILRHAHEYTIRGAVKRPIAHTALHGSKKWQQIAADSDLLPATMHCA